uniref:CDC42 small effector 1 n=1 Tax=Nothobranchius furzeri TaxID=105023 RepID=A0A8C6NY43_NOTFU
MSDFWHKMGCCVVAKPPPKKKRRKIDRSMIGEPTNFIHLTHIGSGEMSEGMQPLYNKIHNTIQIRIKGTFSWEGIR